MADARADIAMAVRRRHRPFYPHLDRLRLQRQLCDADRLPAVSGFCRGYADPCGFLRGLPAVSGPAAPRRHYDGRHHGGAGAHRRAGGRRLDHRDLVLALAVFGQRFPGSPCRVRYTIAAAARKAQFGRSGDARRIFTRSDGHCACGPGDRAEAGPAVWLAFSALLRAVRAERRRGNCLCVSERSRPPIRSSSCRHWGHARLRSAAR